MVPVEPGLVDNGEDVEGLRSATGRGDHEPVQLRRSGQLCDVLARPCHLRAAWSCRP